MASSTEDSYQAMTAPLVVVQASVNLNSLLPLECKIGL